MSTEIQNTEKPPFVLQRGDTDRAMVGCIPGSIQEAITISHTLFRSKLFPDIQSAEQAVAKILAGAELGIPPVASLNSFHIVKGKIMMHYSAIGGRVRAIGYDYRLIVDTDDEQAIEFFNCRGISIGVSRFTKEDAKRAGTQNMTAHPRTMMFARAMSNGARRFAPEAFNGLIVYANEERAEIEASAPESLVERVVDQVREATGSIEDQEIIDFDHYQKEFEEEAN